MSVFDAGYAGWYDTLYGEKDYPGECAYLQELFQRRGVTPKAIIDLGCGTGGHALLLAQRGYAVTAVDRSAAMLQTARDKAACAGLNVDFRQEDITRMGWRENFDAAIAMFAVAGYLAEDREMEDFLTGVMRSLRPGGIFIFDGWYGPGVLRERPATRRLEIPLGDGEVLLRSAEPRLDIQAQTVEIHYRLQHTRAGAVIAESEERHLMRFFFPRELCALLHQAGFVDVSLHPWLEPDQPLQEQHWHFSAVAAKRK
ncbi:MAG: class I SAM-dependent methyltransferase [Candidatus Aminicenantes bacterium]|nr:class I SAM-dependent methyltransferase [Candidatus Aminicenantes bacterium]